MTGLLQISGKVFDRATFCNRAVILTPNGVLPETEPQRPASVDDDEDI